MKNSKQKSVAQLKKLADKYFSEYVGLGDSDSYGYADCITCSVRKPWRELQNGHFVSRGVSLLRYNDLNCNAQCMADNVFKHGDLYNYAKKLDEKYGTGTADSLYDQRFSTHKYTRDELEQIIADCKEFIKAKTETIENHA